MEVRTSSHCGKIVFQVRGPIQGADSALLSRELETAKNSPCESVIVDLAHVPSMESTAVGALAFSSTVLGKVHKKLVVLAPPHVKDMFDLCNLGQVVRILGVEEILSPEEVLSKSASVQKQ